MATEQLENLGSEDAKWLGKYSRVHMNVFGTPLRVMDMEKVRISGTSMAMNTSISLRASR
mgnify:CR=1 FL=1